MKLPAWLWTPKPAVVPEAATTIAAPPPDLADRPLSPGSAALLLEEGQLGWRTLSVVVLELCARERLHLRDRVSAPKGFVEIEVVTNATTDALTYDPNMSAEAANLLALLGGLVGDNGDLTVESRTLSADSGAKPEQTPLARAVGHYGTAAFVATIERSGLMTRSPGPAPLIAAPTALGDATKKQLTELRGQLSEAYAGRAALPDRALPRDPAGLSAPDRLAIWSVTLGLEPALYDELARAADGLYAGWAPTWSRDIAPVPGFEVRAAAIKAAIQVAEEMLGGDSPFTPSAGERMAENGLGPQPGILEQTRDRGEVLNNRLNEVDD